MINEERMSVYVRLGIRLLYKGLKSRRMEKDKSKSGHPTDWSAFCA
jgi:phosphatidylserine decarboxylase